MLWRPLCFGAPSSASRSRSLALTLYFTLFIMSHPSDGLPRPQPKLSNSVLDLFSMKGKVTAITGGGGGIGFSVAEAIAEVGGDVALLYRSSKDMDERAEALAKKYGVRCAAFQGDVCSWESVKSVVDAVVKHFGRIDCYIANAGGGVQGGTIDISIEDWHKTQEANYYSVFYASKAVGPYFKAQGSGSFIATTSISAHIVNVPFDQPAYNAAKAATLALCRSIARDWRLFARVNTVSPGFFDTPMGAQEAVMPYLLNKAVLGRQGDVKELKGVYLLLASDASTYTTGADYLVDGGYVLT